jgi:hypothetical protein
LPRCFDARDESGLDVVPPGRFRQQCRAIRKVKIDGLPGDPRDTGNLSD